MYRARKVDTINFTMLRNDSPDYDDLLMTRVRLLNSNKMDKGVDKRGIAL